MSANPRNLGVLNLSNVFLLESLGLPETAEILGVQMAISRPDTLQLLVSHPDLPLHELGKAIPHVTAEVRTDAEVTKPAPQFVRWVL